ncbi:MAG: ORF6N domain-containing protein [Verrucomicrobia bacterium]|nr:ORF6N domain-containing protein [Verrucomicrobiota bacterium]MBV9658406.1 ORF6N domain-containing protein [Verrucomicrobiota bacterium]
MSNDAPAAIAKAESRIFIIRGHRVMLDTDLAEIYGVTVKQMLQQVRRNSSRFPEDFAFQLNSEELANLRSQFVTSSSTGYGGRRYAPFVFTEHGALMLASVLNSPRAVEMSVFVVRAFVRLRAAIADNKEILLRLEELERKVAEHDESLRVLVDAVRQLMTPPPAPARPRIGFEQHALQT